MKNVRLFAVAAALGMFASTVAAAESTAKVKWSDDKLDVVRVDEGQKIFLTTPTAQVVVDDKKAGCQNGSDDNKDGYVDLPVYGIDPLAEMTGPLSKTLWPSLDAAVKAVTRGGTLVLEPNETLLGDDGYLLTDELSLESWKSFEEMFDALVAAKKIEVTYDEDGAIAQVIYGKGQLYNTTGDIDETKWAVADMYRVATATGGRKSDENIIEYVCTDLVNSDLTDETDVETLVGAVLNDKATIVVNPYVSAVDSLSAAAETHDVSTVTFDFDNDGVAEETATGYNAITGYWDTTTGVKAPIVFVTTNRKGEYSFAKITDVLTPDASNLADAYKADEVVQGTSSKTTSAVIKGTIYASKTVFTASSGDTALTYAWVDTGDSNKLKYFAGTAIAAGSYTNFWAENSKDITDVKANTQYVLNDGTTFFNGSDVVFAVKASGTKTAYDLTHNEVASGAFDTIAVTTVDKWGYPTTKIVDPNSATIKYVSNDTHTTTLVTGKNYTTYFDTTKLGSGAGKGYLLVNEVSCDDNGATSEVANGTSNFQFLETISTAYDYVVSGVGYSKATKDTTGAYAIIEPKAATSTATAVIASSDFATTFIFNAKTTANSAYDAIKAAGKLGYITIIDISNVEEVGYDTDGDNNDDKFTLEDWSVVTQIALPTQKAGEVLANYELTISEDNEFVFNAVATEMNTVAQTAYRQVASSNIVEYYTSLSTGDIENDTKYYVLLDKDGFTYSTTKETGTITAYDGEKIPCILVDLGTRAAHAYYPAFETEEELNAAVAKIFGFEKPLEGTAKDSTSTYGKFYANANGKDASGNALPSSATYVGEENEKCSYEVKSAATVTPDLGDLVLDGSAKAGVYDVKYTASTDGKDVETVVTKVVVAPKYYREYQNGKVVKCTSYWANEPTKVYSVTEYDWDKKVATVTYFDLNNAAAGTQELKLG